MNHQPEDDDSGELRMSDHSLNQPTAVRRQKIGQRRNGLLVAGCHRRGLRR